MFILLLKASARGNGLDNQKSEVVKEASTTFEYLDYNHNNLVTFQEVEDGWKGKYGKVFADVIFREIDLNRDNKINREEWMSFWKAMIDIGYKPRELIKAVFRS